MYYVIELWRARQAWLDLPAVDRRTFLSTMGGELQDLTAAGIQPVGMGTTEPLIEDAPWTFFAVWQASGPDEVKRFAESVNPQLDTYFEQIRLTGALTDPGALADAMANLTADAPA